MEFIGAMAAPACGWNCIGVCGVYCYVPPFYLVAINDDVAWSCILSDVQ